MAATDASKGKPVVVVDDVHVIYKVFGTGKKARGVKDATGKENSHARGPCGQRRFLCGLRR
jgi:hypothetical protein